jgi:hypothetical protein
MVYLVIGIVVALLIYAIAKAAAGNRYANMTAEQFEQEAKRSSKVGAVVAGFQKIVDPGHRVEYAQEQVLRIEADTAESGDRPETAPLDRDSDNAGHSELERNIIEEG